ncbi:substrate-binding domain-containing protein, partial [Acetobacter lambici]
LGVSKAITLHQNLLNSYAEKILIQKSLFLWGDYQGLYKVVQREEYSPHLRTIHLPREKLRIIMRAEHVRANKRVIGPDDLCHERLIATLTSVTPTLDVVLCAPITSANPSVSTLMDIAAQT